MNQLRRVEGICEATAKRDWERAVELGSNITGTDSAGLRGVECRCLAQLELGRIESCAAEMTSLLQSPETGDWLPMPALVAVSVNYLTDRGQLEEAAAVVGRGTDRYHDDPLLLTQEFLVRTQVEDESTVLGDLENRLLTLGAVGNPVALLIADRFMLRQQWDRARAVLDRIEPRPEEIDRWFELDTEVVASTDDSVALRRSMERWLQVGGHDPDLRARYAFLVSVKGLVDPRASHLELFERATALDDQIENRELAAAVRFRFIRYLAFIGQHQRALDLYDVTIQKHGSVAGITREDLLPTASQQWIQQQEAGRPIPVGTIRFRSGLRSGDRLAISLDSGVPVDASFENHAVVGRTVAIERTLGESPVRWVVRDPDDQVVASGATWPEPGTVREVDVIRREPSPSAGWSLGPGQSADGRRRVVLLVLDGADWRLIRYLEACGNLPVLSALAAGGQRGVLLSDPPFTAAALHAMVHPEETGISFPGLLYQLGQEVAALNFVGRNPMGFLEAVIPGADDLFESLGRGDLAVANLLRSSGAIQAGRHAQLTGPQGRVREVSGYRGARALTEEELAYIPGFAGDVEKDRPLLEEIAADFDTLLSLIAEGEVDLAALRVAALDILSHTHYGPLTTSSQDDGDRTLLRIYSYIDLRLAALTAALDADDVLVVMSDHGIRNSLEHDPNCLFVAIGPGVETGRIDGRPELSGTGRMLADLFGVETDWPATGMESWVGQLPAGL